MKFLDDSADEKLAGVVSAFDARAAKLGVL
jgi:hypothetical protein